MQSNEIQFEVDGNAKFLTNSEMEDFEERAAIIEFEAGMNRESAEILAFKAIMKARERFKKAM